MNLAGLSRKQIAAMMTVGIVLILAFSCFFFGVYYKRGKTHCVGYEDNGNIEYSVALKDNEFYEKNYLEKDRQYIASLIKHIEAKFNYRLQLEEEVPYEYKYRVVANINVVDNKTNKVIYDLSENIVEEVIGQSNNFIQIQENIEIDYNKYNELINKFVAGYKLRDVPSELSVNMQVGISGIEEDFQKNVSNMSINMPLTTDTIGIDLNYDVARNPNSVIEIKSISNSNKTFLYLSVLFLVVDVAAVIGLIIYIRSSSTEEEKYKNELKKIINSYGTYISEVEDEFDMNGYQILKVKKFIDLLEIRDTMHIPIIMIENKENLATCFMIPTDNKILYFYSLGITQYALPIGSNEKGEEKV